MNSNGKKSIDTIQTQFKRLRIVIIKNKAGNIVDYIDSSDFKFAKTNNRFVFMKNNDNESFFDAVPAGCAFNSNLNNYSEAKLDLG